jgi:hypothetical protein
VGRRGHAAHRAADDGSRPDLAQHYFDSRGVARVYAMTITDEAWTLVREHPGFSQRFVGAFSGDGRVIDGRWEICRDGSNSELDCRLKYTKSS